VQRALADERDGALHRPGTDPRRRWLAVAERLDGAVRAGALGPLWTREEAAAAGAGPGEVRRLVEEGLVVPVPPFLATRSTYAHLATSVAARVAEGPATTASLKSLLGLTRRTAIPLLEALDRDGVTRREGDARVPGGRPAGGR
ncbi:MAG: SelB C-terminal domain-containing protein, partial [Acidimicrobiales bacterium]|nr:SelB C-terminal domain-containing protein [Acidimicrobiales bacterium]